MFRRTVLGLVALAILLGACSSGPAKTGASKDGAAASRPGAGNASASASAAPAVRPTKSLDIVGTAELHDCYALILQRTPAVDVLRPYVHVTVETDRGFGDCRVLEPGKTCFIALEGTWRYGTETTGNIAVEIVEDGKVLARRLLLSAGAPSGSLFRGAAVRYLPTKGAKVAKMRGVLLNGEGKEVARSEDQIMRLPTCNPRTKR